MSFTPGNAPTNERHFCLDDSPAFQMLELDEVDSTNDFLRDYRPMQPREITLATAEYQCAGRGQRGNSWESDRGRNLLFSLLVHPGLPVSHVFALSESIALAVRDAVSAFVPAGEIEVKWPNDVYCGGRKLAGILIETTLQGKLVADAIIGVGINVNQQTFRSDAPNPVSLLQLTGQETERRFVLERVMEHFTANLRALKRGEYGGIHQRYMDCLYRRRGMHPYRDGGGDFRAEIVGVEPSGHLLLRDGEGTLRRYAFKEVEFGK